MFSLLWRFVISVIAFALLASCGGGDLTPIVPAPVEGPEIDIEYNGSPIVDGASITGLNGAAGSAISAQIEVKNPGTETLTFNRFNPGYKCK